MSDIFGKQAVRVPDVAEPIRAYRGWSVSHLGLKGYGESIWPKSQPLIAACVVESHMNYWSSGSTQHLPHACPSPNGEGHAGYGCGIYAYKSLDALMAERWTDGGGPMVFGEVLLWGDVYEHANGYRAEHAKPAALYDLPLRGGIVTPSMLAGFYDIPLVKPDLDVDELDLIARQRDESYSARMTPRFTSSGTITSGNTTVSFGGNTLPVAGSTFTFALEDEPRKRARRSRFWWVYASVAGAQGGAAVVDLALGSPMLAAAMSGVCGLWTWLAVKEWRDG